MSNCGFCGRVLRRPKSIKNGFGPKCSRAILSVGTWRNTEVIKLQPPEFKSKASLSLLNWQKSLYKHLIFLIKK